MRSSAAKQQANKQVKSRLHTLERNFHGLVTAGKKDEAQAAFRGTISAFDKAAKTGVIPSGTADRKKSRLAAGLAKLSKA